MSADDAVAKAHSAYVSAVAPVGEAHGAMGRAAAAAETVHKQAARAGGRVVAAQLAQIHRELLAASQHVHAVADAVRTAGTQVKDSAGRNSTEDMVTVLNQAVAATQGSVERLGAVKAQVQPLPARIAALLQRAQPQPLVAAVTAALRSLDPAAAALRSAEATTRESIAAITTTGNF